MSKLTAPLVELFSSVQGEGVYNGMPSIFVRFAKCNLTCPGFSKEEDTERVYDFSNVIDVKDIDANTLNVGCDSVYAWHKTARHLWEVVDAETLTKKVEAILPKANGLKHFAHNQKVHLVLTGGEPFVHLKFIVEWLTYMINKGVNPFEFITFETNGTKLCSRALSIVMADNPKIEFLFSLSPKLASSGEPLKRRLISNTLEDFDAMSHFIENARLSMKFVTDGSLSDMQEIPEFTKHFREYFPVYLMPVGALLEQQNEVLPKVVDAAMKFGYGVSLRSHLNLFGNAIGT